MKKSTLPKDIRAYLFRKFVVRSLICLALEIGMLYLIFENTDHSVLEYGFDNRTVWNALLALLPFVVTGVPVVFFDKPWQGVITGTYIKQVKKVTMSGRGAGIPYHTIAIIGKLNMSTGEQQEKELRVPKFEGLPGEVANAARQYKLEHLQNDMEHYHPGDIVQHLYGLKYPLVIRTERESKVFNCVMCGAQNKAERERCQDCRYTLIKVYRDDPGEGQE